MPWLDPDLALPCRVRSELWFSDDPDEVESAKLRCASCPVRADCLAGALTRREVYGVWGGELVVDGAVRARKRRRGRPPRAESLHSTAGAVVDLAASSAEP